MNRLNVILDGRSQSARICVAIMWLLTAFLIGMIVEGRRSKPTIQFIMYEQPCHKVVAL